MAKREIQLLVQAIIKHLMSLTSTPNSIRQIPLSRFKSGLQVPPIPSLQPLTSNFIMAIAVNSARNAQVQPPNNVRVVEDYSLRYPIIPAQIAHRDFIKTSLASLARFNAKPAAT